MASSDVEPNLELLTIDLIGKYNDSDKQFDLAIKMKYTNVRTMCDDNSTFVSRYGPDSPEQDAKPIFITCIIRNEEIYMTAWDMSDKIVADHIHKHVEICDMICRCSRIEQDATLELLDTIPVEIYTKLNDTDVQSLIFAHLSKYRVGYTCLEGFKWSIQTRHYFKETCVFANCWMSCQMFAIIHDKTIYICNMDDAKIAEKVLTRTFHTEP